MHGLMAYKVTRNKSTQQLLMHVMIDQTLEKITQWTANFTWAKWTQISDSIEDSITRASLVIRIFKWAVICDSNKASTLKDFIHTHTPNCRQKSDEFWELSKGITSDCDVTFEQYCN